MIRTEANGKDRGSRQEEGADGRGKLSCACILRVDSGQSCFPGRKKSPEMDCACVLMAERHRQRFVRGDISVLPMWPLPPEMDCVIHRKTTENLSLQSWHFHFVFSLAWFHLI